ncbi:MAG TPA: RDD family protein [Polyangia bacterium]
MDRVTIETPERVALEYELAGLGSRFAALLVDGLIQSALGALLLAGLVLLGALSCDPVLGAMDRHARGEPDAFAALAAGRVLLVGGGALTLVQVGYHALFEGLRDGQTPGKRLLGIRVVQEGGLRLRPSAALVRNLLRPLDFLPVCFGLGAVLALLTARGQRLGDLAAHTLVVRERAAAGAVALAPLDAPATTPATGALSPDEAALVRGFLDRRDGFDAPARVRLAGRLAHGLRRRHGDLGQPALEPEGYLERLAAERRA